MNCAAQTMNSTAVALPGVRQVGARSAAAASARSTSPAVLGTSPTHSDASGGLKAPQARAPGRPIPSARLLAHAARSAHRSRPSRSSRRAPGMSADAAPLPRLTFDDGPSELTSGLLDVLARHGVRAIFFVLGASIGDAPDALRRAASEGHEIGNHAWDHVRLSQLEDEQIETQLRRTSAAVEALTGRRPSLFRPPYGDRDARVDAIAAAQGMETLLWDVNPHDYRLPGAAALAAQIIAAAPGAVVLLHDGRRAREQTVVAVDRALGELRRR